MKRMIGIGVLTAAPAVIGLAAGLLGATHAASAQNAYSYPWCSIGSQDGIRTCYFNSEKECRETIAGVHDICVRNLEYRGGGGGGGAEAPPPAQGRRR